MHSLEYEEYDIMITLPKTLMWTKFPILSTTNKTNLISYRFAPHNATLLHEISCIKTKDKRINDHFLHKVYRSPSKGLTHGTSMQTRQNRHKSIIDYLGVRLVTSK